ncbi:MAG: hypothetical protein HFJ34_03745 [Clostridia bacterium]|nr:hypothetical protein [Clostridia bacterium]
MKKLFLIRNPKVFQGEKYIHTHTNYFEGWYFKNCNTNQGISFIPGISISREEKKAFIQVITQDCSYFVNYDIKDFKFNTNPFYIKIGKNYFSESGIKIDIKNDEQNLKIYGKIQYSDSQNIRTNLFNPNIMGPFSYIPFMECNHAILSMRNVINGWIAINHHKIIFNNDIGYIEKDWGSSFPKSYLWCQGNHFKNSKSSFMISIANIPFKCFSFTGLICDLVIDNHNEFKFTTYNHAKIQKYEINNLINVILTKGSYRLNVETKCDKGLKLMAPVKGKMEKDIFESISANITVTLKKHNHVIFSDSSQNCGLEIVE